MGRASKVNRGSHIIWVCGTTQFSVWYHTAGGKWQAERSDLRSYLPCTTDVGPPRAALIRPVSILLGRVDRINSINPVLEAIGSLGPGARVFDTK
jgi:hypothetical protein